MKRKWFITPGLLTLILLMGIPSCKQDCVNNVLLQTTSMDLQVNAENKGLISNVPQNVTDTIRSETRQFYNYPGFRRFGQLFRRPGFSLVNSAYAQESCPDQEEYISRMDETKTEFSLNIPYDASAVGLGVLAAGTDLLQVGEVSSAYLQDFINNVFLNGGAPAPLTVSKNFFQPINDQWVTFYFVFEEIDGTIFEDSARAFVQIAF